MLAYRSRQILADSAIKQTADAITNARSRANRNRSRAEQYENQTLEHLYQVKSLVADAKQFKCASSYWKYPSVLFEYLATGTTNDKIPEQFEPFPPVSTLAKHSFDKRFLAELIYISVKSLAWICTAIDKDRYLQQQIEHRTPIAEMLLQHNAKISAYLQAFIKQQSDSMSISVFSGNLLRALPKLTEIQIAEVYKFIDQHNKQTTFTQDYERYYSELLKYPQPNVYQIAPCYLFKQKVMSKFLVDINFNNITNIQEQQRQACPIYSHLLSLPEFKFLYFDDQYYKKAQAGQLTSIEVAIKFESLQTKEPGLLRYLPEENKLDDSLAPIYNALKGDI